MDNKVTFKTSCIPSGIKDHFFLSINGEPLGTFERSELRSIIERIDNSI